MNLPHQGVEQAFLLSRLTGRSLEPRDVDRLTLFLASLISILLGAIAIDRSIVDEERRQLQRTLDRFVPRNINIHRLTQKLINGIYQQQVYLNPDEFLTLAKPLPPSERMLLLSLGCEISAADGAMDFREKLYLQSIAQRLDLATETVELLETAFSKQPIEDIETVQVLQDLLDPQHFENDTFARAAKRLLKVFSEDEETEG